MPRKRAAASDRVRISGRVPTDVPTVKSAERVLKILEYFDDIHARATVMDVADTLGLPQSSTSSLLRSLVALGYLEYEPYSRTYLPTVRVALLGLWINPNFVVPGKVIELMHHLSDRTGHTIMLVSRNGQSIQMLHVMHPKQTDRPYLSIGTTRSIVTSGSGYVLLSTLPDSEIRRIVIRHNAETRGREPVVDIKELLTALNKIRNDGFALRHGNGTTLWMPLLGVTDYPLAIGIGSTVAEEILDNERYLTDLMRGAIVSYLGPQIKPAHDTGPAGSP